MEYWKGNLNHAMEFEQLALDEFFKSNDRLSIARIKSNLGSSLFDLGETEMGIQLLRDALDEYIQLGLTYAQGTAN